MNDLSYSFLPELLTIPEHKNPFAGEPTLRYKMFPKSAWTWWWWWKKHLNCELRGLRNGIGQRKKKSIVDSIDK